MSRRGRGRGRAGIFFPKPPAVSEESRPGEEPTVGPPPLFPELKNLPEIPKIDKYGDELLARWHKYRHVCRSGPYYLENSCLPDDEEVDHFSVKKHSDIETKGQESPNIESVMDLSKRYFPLELTSKKQREESFHQTMKTKGQETPWSTKVLNETEEYTRFDEAAKKVDNDKKVDSDDEGNELPEDRGEDEYSQDDYQQGEHFDDDEGYDEFEDAGDEGPVY